VSFLVRDIELSDLDQILAIEVELFGSTAWNRDLFLDEISRIPGARWYQVLGIADQIIGYVGMATMGTTADIQTIAVIPSQQRHGYGAMLLGLALAEAKRRGIIEVFLEVAVENEPAIKLYENFGFAQISIRPNYYGPGKNAYVMMRQVGEA
jgi:ribosomal-protein-alanine N-acetyltransferase